MRQSFCTTRQACIALNRRTRVTQPQQYTTNIHAQNAPWGAQNDDLQSVMSETLKLVKNQLGEALLPLLGLILKPGIHAAAGILPNCC